MSTLFPASTAAEEFDRVVAGRASPDVARRYAALAQTVTLLRAQPVVSPREEFVAQLRADLLARESANGPAEVVRPIASAARKRRERRLGVGAATLVLLGGSAGVAAASEGTVPGQALYPVKRVVEQVVLQAHLSDAGRGRTELAQAGTRMSEIRELVSRGAGPATIDDSFSDFRSSAESGATTLFLNYQSTGDAQDIRAVSSFTQAQMAAVDDLAATDQGAGNLDSAADLLADLDKQARTLCRACSDGPEVELPGSLGSAASAATLESLVSMPSINAGLLLASPELTRLQLRAEHLAMKSPSAPSAPPPRAAPPDAGVAKGAPAATAPSVDRTKASIDGLVTELRDTGGSTGREVAKVVHTVTGTVTTTITMKADKLQKRAGDATKPLTEPLQGTLDKTLNPPG